MQQTRFYICMQKIHAATNFCMLHSILKKRHTISKERSAFILGLGCTAEGPLWAVMWRPLKCKRQAQVFKCVAHKRCEVMTCKSLFDYCTLILCLSGGPPERGQFSSAIELEEMMNSSRSAVLWFQAKDPPGNLTTISQEVVRSTSRW